MKKNIPFIFLFLIILTGCKANIYYAEIKDFSQSATVNVGNFSYTCDISKFQDVVSVTATSTNAEGICISYNGQSAVFSYCDMEYEISSENIDNTNPAKAIYDVFQILSSSQDVALKTADGFRYEGKSELGDFILLQNNDYSYKSLQFKDANIKIVFKNL